MVRLTERQSATLRRATGKGTTEHNSKFSILGNILEEEVLMEKIEDLRQKIKNIPGPSNPNMMAYTCRKEPKAKEKQTRNGLTQNNMNQPTQWATRTQDRPTQTSITRLSPTEQGLSAEAQQMENGVLNCRSMVVDSP